MTVHTAKTRMSTAYVVEQLGRGLIVDTGTAGQAEAILAVAAAAHLMPGDIKLIVVTHAHADHAGSAAELHAMTGAPVAVHRADAAALTAGGPVTLQPTGPAGRAMRPMMRAPLPPLVADVQLEDLDDLAQYDLSGTVLSTPGHTAGSISVALDDGDLLVGDALSGGLVRPSRPGMPLFATDSALTRRTIGKLAEHRPRLVHPGHGGPIAGDRLAELATRLGANGS